MSWQAALLGLGLMVLSVALLLSATLGWAAGIVLTGLVMGAVALMSFAGPPRLAVLAAERPGELICTFARAFGRRTVDTWIIRAVYEELRPYCRSGRSIMPLRSEDHLEDVLGIDAEELDDLAGVIAHRTRRSLAECDRNPLYGNVVTVGDLVWFFENQPLEDASPEV